MKYLLCALFLLSTLPFVAYSQEESTDTSISSATSTTPEGVEEVATSPQVQNPYEVESLIGDGQVFNDFVLGPGKIELVIAPGESKTFEVTVSNRTGETKRFDIDTEDLGQSGNPSRPVVLLGDDVGPYSLKDFISVPARQFDLEHNMRARIPVTVSVPADADAGGLYGSVLVRTVTLEAQPGDRDAGTAPSSAIVSRIGSLVFITVPGEVERAGELRDFSTKNNQKWFQSGPVGLEILYENTGTVHLNPYGEVRITNMLGEEVGFVELEPWFTLPGTLRLREISWNREVLYGRYTATLLLNRGYGNEIDEQTITFWVIPWQPIALGFVVLFVLFFLIRLFFKKFTFSVKTK